jgi:hypothetical protein
MNIGFLAKLSIQVIPAKKLKTVRQVMQLKKAAPCYEGIGSLYSPARP